jgi:glycosyltransferase involved in cell wall biosynthesis
MSDKQKTLVVAHAHPDFSIGGGELAGYNLYQAFEKLPEVGKSYFLGRIDRKRFPTGEISLRRDTDYIWEQGLDSAFTMRTANLFSLLWTFKEFIQSLQPTIISLHHYIGFGLDFVFALKKFAPEAKILLTLHEYWGICVNQGQMIKNTKKLCTRASLEDCHLCAQDKSIEDMWLRKHFFDRAFSRIDGFVSPSEFLRRRYVAWGIPKEKMTVIENGQEPLPKLAPRPLQNGEGRKRFAYFGQINQFKGLLVVLQGLQLLSRKERRDIVLEIHGANLEMQEKAFQETFHAACDPLVQEGVVHWRGSYRHEDLRSRMKMIDWVIVPSIWWENSPLVIQEAFLHGRPVMVSDIGGMAEKVKHGVDGVHVQVGNPTAWGETMLQYAKHPEAWDALYERLPRPISHQECAEKYLRYAVG